MEIGAKDVSPLDRELREATGIACRTKRTQERVYCYQDVLYRCLVTLTVEPLGPDALIARMPRSSESRPRRLRKA